MTGPEHYREAERLLLTWPKDGSLPHEDITMIHAAAQVHATLALAAATALGGANDTRMPTPDWQTWYDAAATRQDVTP